jgi:hypothetical protein
MKSKASHEEQFVEHHLIFTGAEERASVEIPSERELGGQWQHVGQLFERVNMAPHVMGSTRIGVPDESATLSDPSLLRPAQLET